MIEKIGIIGGGQLGRMLTEAAIPMGFEVSVIDPVANSPAHQVGAKETQAPLNSIHAINRLVETSDVTTWEIEHIPALHLVNLAEQGYNIESSPATLAIIQDKLVQKQLLEQAGIPVAPFSAELDPRANVFFGASRFVVKTRQGGFDGRGNLVTSDLMGADVHEFLAEKNLTLDDVYAELALPFEKELAVVAARDVQGNILTYPTVETKHENNICHIVLSPADISPAVRMQANSVARSVMELLEGAGVFAIEMFVVNDQIIVNEIAPRVHNSGHLTIEGNATSQFEQHIRAITGMSLGSTALRAPAVAMINILGKDEGPLSLDGLDQALALPDVHAHLYGKAPRPARKIGHLTVLGETLAEVEAVATQARSRLKI
jgi:5-(carboxyamino)imidazole ribonucleotide synthase